MNQRMHAALKTDSWQQGNLIICQPPASLFCKKYAGNTIFMMKFNCHDLCLFFHAIRISKHDLFN